MWKVLSRCTFYLDLYYVGIKPTTLVLLVQHYQLSNRNKIHKKLEKQNNLGIYSFCPCMMATLWSDLPSTLLFVYLALFIAGHIH